MDEPVFAQQFVYCISCSSHIHSALSRGMGEKLPFAGILALFLSPPGVLSVLASGHLKVQSFGQKY